MRAIVRTMIGLAVAASLLAPAVAAAQESSDGIRQQVDLSRPKKFAFKSLQGVPAVAERDSADDSPFVDERTNISIAAQLERRGWTRDDDHPDFYIVTRRTFKTEYSLRGPYWSGYNVPTAWWGPYWGWTGPAYVDDFGLWNTWGPVYVDERIRGTLTIDLVDATNGQLMWRGAGTKTVHEHSKASSRTKHVNDEVSDIFERFPSSGR
jgi:hypothetical protein